MKKLIFAFVILITMSTQAQDGKREFKERKSEEKRTFLKDLTPEEIATLKTKKMTLHLDLTDAQQREVKKINLENATQRNTKREVHKSNRESGNATKPTKGERLKMMNERLDQQIVTKKKVKSILNEGQYEKWEKSLKHRAEKKGKLREGKSLEKGKR
tara:strand:- start:23599 stop:24072 length:474 start_codon:yes stop_codon:yes gene_type:complete